MQSKTQRGKWRDALSTVLLHIAVIREIAIRCCTTRTQISRMKQENTTRTHKTNLWLLLITKYLTLLSCICFTFYVPHLFIHFFVASFDWLWACVRCVAVCARLNMRRLFSYDSNWNETITQMHGTHVSALLNYHRCKIVNRDSISCSKHLHTHASIFRERSNSAKPGPLSIAEAP